MVHPTFIFAADNMIVELKSIKVMAGLFFIFLITIALGELVSDYLKDLNREEAR